MRRICDATTVTGYMIERTLVDGSQKRLTSFGGSTGTWSDTTPKKNGQTYQYRVSVSRGGALSDWSEPVTVGWLVPPSTDARLSTLSTSGVTLAPSFDPQHELYRGSQDGVAALTTVTATPIGSGGQRLDRARRRGLEYAWSPGGDQPERRNGDSRSTCWPKTVRRSACTGS